MIEKYLESRFFTLYFLPFILGSLTVLSFQPFNFTLINFLVLPLFFYLIVYIKRKSKSIYRKKPYKKNLFIFGTAFGFAFYLSGIHWITFSLTFDESFKILIPIGLILIPLFLSLFFSIVTLIIGPYLNLNFSSLLILSASLALSDFIRDKILTGFPWNLWVYSLSWSTEILQILEKIGLFAFNLITITIFMLPAVFIFRLNLTKKIFVFFFVLLSLLSLYIYGNHSINLNKKNLNEVNEKFNVKVISPNFELKYGLQKKQVESRLLKLIKYSEPDEKIKTLFVWPEGVFSGYNFSEISLLKDIFINNFDKNHFIAFGINRMDENGRGVYNSLVIVNNQMEILQEYKKQKLVPFGEFLPFEIILGNLGLKKVTEGFGSFLKGGKQGNLKVDTLNILPLICYEIIFTQFIQQSSLDTNLIINVSEDGWFGETIGPYQHFAKATFRSIEQNSFLVRSANKGISAIISNKGEIIKNLQPNETGNIQLEIPLIKNKYKNRNDLIFFLLLFTYILIFYFYKKYDKK